MAEKDWALKVIEEMIPLKTVDDYIIPLDLNTEFTSIENDNAKAFILGMLYAYEKVVEMDPTSDAVEYLDCWIATAVMKLFYAQTGAPHKDILNTTDNEVDDGR